MVGLSRKSLNRVEILTRPQCCSVPRDLFLLEALLGVLSPPLSSSDSGLFLLPTPALPASLSCGVQHTALQNQKERAASLSGPGRWVNPYWKNSFSPEPSPLQNQIWSCKTASPRPSGQGWCEDTDNNAEGASLTEECSLRDLASETEGWCQRRGWQAGDVEESWNRDLVHSLIPPKADDDNQLCHTEPDAGSWERPSLSFLREQPDPVWGQQLPVSFAKSLFHLFICPHGPSKAPRFAETD